MKQTIVLLALLGATLLAPTPLGQPNRPKSPKTVWRSLPPISPQRLTTRATTRMSVLNVGLQPVKPTPGSPSQIENASKKPIQAQPAPPAPQPNENTDVENPAEPQEPSEPEFEEELETTVTQFRGSDASEELWEGFSPLMAIRTLTTTSSDEALGFGGDKSGTLTIQQAGDASLTLEIGGETYGSKDRYLRYNDVLYLVDDKHLRSVSSAKARLVERRVHLAKRRSSASPSSMAISKRASYRKTQTTAPRRTGRVKAKPTQIARLGHGLASCFDSRYKAMRSPHKPSFCLTSESSWRAKAKPGTSKFSRPRRILIRIITRKAALIRDWLS